MEQLSFFSIEKKIQNAITLLKMFEAKAIKRCIRKDTIYVLAVGKTVR